MQLHPDIMTMSLHPDITTPSLHPFSFLDSISNKQSFFCKVFHWVKKDIFHEKL